MSDVLPDEILQFLNFERFKNCVRIDTDHCLQYIRRQSVSDKEIILTAHLPYECVRVWCGARQKALAKQIPCSYVKIFNAFLYERIGFRVKNDWKRVEERLRKATVEVKTKFIGKNGTTYRKICQKEMRVSLQMEDLVTLSEVDLQLTEQKSLNNELQKKKDNIQERYDSLLKDMSEQGEAQEAERIAMTNVGVEIQDLKLQNQNFQNYIERLGQELDFQNSGGKLSDVGERHQRRKIREVKTKVEKALWFAKTFGLDLQSAIFKDEHGANHTLSYSEKVRKSYKDLTEADKQKVKNILFILDKFCIGEEAYHELSMVTGNELLPRSYLIKQCKDELNKLCHIVRTPGTAQGAQLDFLAELESVIRNQIHQKVLNIEDPQLKLRVKLSGDGAKMSRLTNFVVISFSILNSQKDVMSSKGNHTVAIIKGHESYELLETSCSNIFKQVNCLIKDKMVIVDGTKIPVEVYLGGDYKFLLLILGMKSATSDHACIWCIIHKLERYDMSKPMEYYWGDLVRTISQIKECAKKNKFSCQHQPLIDISLENVVLDELHLMLRVTDKLTKNLVTDAIEWDRKENLDKAPSQRTDHHLQSLVKCISSCGVSFNVWEKMDADGKGSGLHDFTSLMGSDKKLLLKNLPEKLPGVIRPETRETVVKIWKDFAELYKILGCPSPTDEQIQEYFTKAVNWIQLFVSLSGKSMGYEKARVTPYMHAMVYHVPKFMHLHEGIKKFTGQGVEKLNDDCRRVHLQRSNKWDASKDILLVGKRVEQLAECERTHRNYQKQNISYWESGIKDMRAKRVRISAELVDDNQEPWDFDVDTLTAHEIKDKLKEMGIKTRFRCLKKLKKLLIETIRNKENESPNSV